MNIPDISHPALKTIVAHKPHLLWDEKGNPCIKHIAKELQSELEKRLEGLSVSMSDIEGLKTRFVLLIGSDDDLLDAVAAYIYCRCSVNGCTEFYYQSSRGKPDDWVASELTTQSDFFNDTTIRQYKAIVSKEGSGTQFSVCASTGYPKTMNGDLLDHIEQGRSVFLGDLKYQNSLLLEGLGKKIASIKTHWEMYQTDKRGLLIVSTLSKKDLPVYFAKQFEVIDFNPKQPTDQAMPEARNTASRLLEEPCNFNWETKEGKVYSNGTEVVSLTPLQQKLFLALYEKGEKFVSSETLKACWDTKPEYGSFLTDAMSGLECSLRMFLGVKKDVFEKQKDRKKIVAYKLPL